jgi:antirestriction protein ArdC
MTEKAKETLDGLVRQISGAQTSGFIRHRLFSDGTEIPCRNWSPLNQFIAFVHGTDDARGIRQWNAAGRKVKKGARSFGILVPMLYPKKQEEKDRDEGKPGDEEEPEKELAGFKLMPVFRAEDTEGAPLDYEEKMKSLDIGQLPLIGVARKLGVTVKAGLTFGGSAASYRPGVKRITMGTADSSVFLHELSHAVDYALPGRKDDYAFGETVAELSAAFLGSLHGINIDIPSTKAYIDGWAGKGHAAFRLMDAVKRAEEIYKFVEAHKDKRRRKKQADHEGILLKPRRKRRKTVFDFG